MALDEEGGLVVAHAGMAVWHFDRLGRPRHQITLPTGLFATNVAFGVTNTRTLFITEAESGTILRAVLPVSGRRMFSHQ